MCIVVAACVGQAKNTYSAFSVGVALPMDASAPVAYEHPQDGTPFPVGYKNLKTGWDGAWTFFGLPFTKYENALSGLAFGGKINYSRWVRDSTWKELTFLGTQGIIRYYLPVKLNRFEFFGQVGGGMFIGEHGYSDPDTLARDQFPTPTLVFKGAKNLGVTLNLGLDWDIVEFTPGMTIVFTKGKPSAWLSISAAAKF
jgi:hypothetical protein